MARVLLLLPTTTYRAADFLAAAARLRVDVVAASEQPSTMARHHPESLLTLEFRDPERAARAAAEYHARYPIDAVVPVDDDTAVVAAAIGAALGLKHNAVEAARAARNKAVKAELFARHGVRAPAYRVRPIDADPAAAARETRYPCVLKPLFLSGSRGVIRADDPAAFLAAWRRIARILAEPETAARGGAAAREILVEEFVPGPEFALEGLLSEGRLRVLALFDKPDPLDGPTFEETLYVTPSRHGAAAQAAISTAAAAAAGALGLREGPIHAEVRCNDAGAWVLEVAARSIGGLCARTLRFGTGLALEDLILCQALDLPIELPERAPGAAGVMMIPIPGGGTLRETRGIEAAKAVPGVEEVTVTARLDQPLVPLPEGASYLGFIFSRAGTPLEAEQALREAHRRLEFVIEPTPAPA
jgi:biotin carboxylase